ncbi:MAG: S41 family peptidase [Gemmataceae bacterium]|nr:S41 family peptidase [Gemmataceae bacterium]MDW8265496.1 S41 family peptidase [Gemmataceae bacterium]
MSRWNLAWLLGVPAVAILGLALSYSAPIRQKDQDYELVRLIVDVLDEVEHNYVRELTPEAKRKLVEDMINGGLEQLDPHSSYINPKEYRQFTRNSKGEFGGVGIQISTDRASGQITVISPMVGTPAYEAGILAGDLIVKIDGQSTENMRLSEAVDRIQGEPGTKVTLTILHEGSKEPVDIELTRAKIVVQSVLGDVRKPDQPSEWDFFIDKTNKIAYVRLVTFNENTAQDLEKVVRQLQAEGVRGLILDLRNNPGGLLRSAVQVADLFLLHGRIVSTRGRNHQGQTYDARGEGTLLEPAARYPMVVLINKYSASASEIVAAALQDHGRAVVIGERSYGKGSVQNILELENHQSALKLTTASYWRPSGQNIHRFPDSKDSDEWGVKPNPGFEVPLSDEERLDYMIYRRDRDIVHGKPGVAPPPKPKAEKEGEKDKKKEPFVDRVLEKALEHLRAEVRKLR